MSDRKVKKYFVKDESLHGVDNDMFNYADISKILDDIVETNTPPFNVAVIGKWGLGKSSLINLVTDRYKKKPKNYLVQEINAWKYEKESLRKVFLKQLWQGLSDKKVHSFEVIRQEISDITREDLNENYPAAKKTDYRFWKYFGILVLCSVIAMLVYKIVQFFILGKAVFSASFWAESFLSYCKNIGTVLFIPAILAVLKMLLNDYKEKQIKKFELSFPIETTDDYEIFLESKIRDHLQKYKDLKIITIIDDLDRLSIDKIVEALDAIKAFVGFDRCIFIVPFDDEIIKRALNKRRAQQFNYQDDVVESELILDKLFQFKVYLPPILDFDIQDYAINLAKQEIPDFLSDYCSPEIMEKVIRRILIHPGVSTPRQVKKLLNAFINNYMVAKEREASGKVEHSLLTSEKGTMQIAKISVLQADFNSFYDLLFKDMGCIDKILKIHREDPEPQYFPPYLKNYFSTTSMGENGPVSYKLKTEFEPLINFLITTEKYTVPSIAPYLYLAQDAISIQTGDEQQRRMTQALRSGNYKTVQAILREEPATAEVIIRNIPKDNLDVPNTLASAINAFTDVIEQYRKELAQAIILRTLELSNTEQKELYAVSAENVFSIYEIGESEDFNKEFLRRYLTKMTDAEIFDKKTFLSALFVIVVHYPRLQLDMQQSVINVTHYATDCTFNNASDLFESVDATDMLSVHMLWGLNWYNLLCKDMNAEEDFSDDTIRQFKRTFESLKEYSEVEELCGPLVQLCDYEQFITVLADILETQIDGVTFKSKLPQNFATQFAEYAVAQDYEECGSDAYRILNGLTFEIKDSNSASMDDFVVNTLHGMTSEKFLVYCGEQKWLDKLPKTIDKFLKGIYAESSLDKLLAKLLPHFTESVKDKFFEGLASKVHYRSGNPYDREVSIVELVVSNGLYNDELNKLFQSHVVQQMKSYWSYDEYYQFVSRIVVIVKAILTQEAVNYYIQAIYDYIYSSDSKKALQLIALVPQMMSPDMFKKIFNRIIEGNQASVFDQAVDVIVDNDKLRPRTQEDVNNYYKYLYEHISVSLNPDKVLAVITVTFSGIHSLPVVVKNAKSNDEHTDEAIVKFLTAFFKKHETENIVRDILQIYADDPSDETVISALRGIEQSKIDDILSGISDKLHENMPVKGIVAVATLGSSFLKLQKAKELLLLCLGSALKTINMIRESKEIMRIINDHKQELIGCKSEIVEVLYEGFSDTDSDEIKEYILSVVSSLKVRSIFRKKLKGDDLEFYKRWSN